MVNQRIFTDAEQNAIYEFGNRSTNWFQFKLDNPRAAHIAEDLLRRECARLNRERGATDVMTGAMDTKDPEAPQPDSPSDVPE
uniref:Uncharacterized protein n=1 Tax=Ditylenchus dipsaci TaxID=166011 RepID=A0A915DBM8_9BILA